MERVSKVARMPKRLVVPERRCSRELMMNLSLLAFVVWLTGQLAWSPGLRWEVNPRLALRNRPGDRMQRRDFGVLRGLGL